MGKVWNESTPKEKIILVATLVMIIWALSVSVPSLLKTQPDYFDFDIWNYPPLNITWLPLNFTLNESFFSHSEIIIAHGNHTIYEGTIYNDTIVNISLTLQDFIYLMQSSSFSYRNNPEYKNAWSNFTYQLDKELNS